MPVRLASLLLAACLGLPSVLSGQDPVTVDSPGWFPFNISGLDDGPADVDLSFLNEKPAGKAGFVRVEGEKFLDGGGKPLRWLGVNIVASACFPAKDKAPHIAGHLAKMGVNIVRFHFLDNQWGMPSLLQKPDYEEWDMEAFDRWDFFVSELKARGIYSNINLHVGREYEGTPKDAPNYSKGLDNFHRPFIKALEDYSRFIFEHKNPYTGLAYRDDPCVGCVEINNENSLVLNPWWLLSVPEPFAGEIRGSWNGWLKERFKTTEKMREAFGVSDRTLGANVISNPKFTDKFKGWRIDRLDGNLAKLEASPSGNGVRWTVLKPGEESWYHQLIFGGLTPENGSRYRLSFRARAEEPRRKLSVTLMQDGGSYAHCGVGGNFDVGTEWNEFTFDGELHDVLPGKTRVSLNVSNQPGVYEFDDVRLQPMPTGFLGKEETLEAGNVPLAERSSPFAVRRAFMEFLGGIEIKYASEFREFLKKECGVKAPVAYSQVLFGGIMGARREFAASDFVDTHGYWQHPHFPNKPWDMKDWEINNVTQLASKEGGTLVEMAAQRPYGKPYTCSEYDIPAPNDYSVEAWPMLAAVAAAQDWSGIYIFNFADDDQRWETTKIDRFFATLGHPAKHALMPWSALAFRLSLVRPAPAGYRLAMSDGFILDEAAATAGDLWGSWRRVWKDQAPKPAGPFGVFDMRTGYQLGSDQDKPRVMMMDNSALSNQQAAWDVGREFLELDTPSAVLLLGKIGTHKLKNSKINVEVAALDGNGHGCIAIAAVDGKPIKESKKVLITALRRAENAGMGWDAKRKTVSDQWGKGPALVQGLKAKITLPEGREWKVQVVTPGGMVGETIGERVNTVEIEPGQKTVWWLGVR